jgi:hypothetical protein
VLADVALTRNLTTFASAYFQRGGFPITLLQYEGNLSSDEAEKITSFWTSMVHRAHRAFKAVLLKKTITPTVIGSSIKDTTSAELYDQVAQNISVAYGIPASMLMSNSSKYGAAMVEDHVKFYTETVIPIAERMTEIWNERVYEPQELSIELEPEKLEVMQQYEITKAAAIVSLTGAPILTVDEGRAMINYAPMAETELPNPDPEASPVAEPDAIDNSGTDTAATDNADSIDAGKAIATERARVKRYAAHRIADGKPFTFKSDVISQVEIEAVAACKSIEELDALNLADVLPQGGRTVDELYVMLERATKAAETLKYDPSQPRDDNGMWTDAGGGMHKGRTASTAKAVEILKMRTSGGASDKVIENYLKDNGIDYVEAYHITGEEKASDVVKHGIRKSSQDNRPAQSYIFLDKADATDSDVADVLGHSDRFSVVRLRIPQKEAAKIKEDNFFNGTFAGVRSGATYPDSIPPEWIMSSSMYKRKQRVNKAAAEALTHDN